VLEELAGAELLVELLVGDEPVLAAVLLAFPALARGGRDGERELGDLDEQGLFQGALARARGTRDYEKRFRNGTTG
jgi:hypothetical protein